MTYELGILKKRIPDIILYLREWLRPTDEVQDTSRDLTLVQVRPRTGRTHQIRVHLAHEHAPILGDTTYGWRHMNRRYQALATRTPDGSLLDVVYDLYYTTMYLMIYMLHTYIYIYIFMSP